MKPSSRISSSLFLALPLLLFSCTRAVDDKTSVTITLPNSQSIQRFSRNLTALNISDGVEAGVANAATDFAPDPGNVAEYDTNCYLVTVSYPEEAANRNYCGSKDLIRAAAAPPVNSPTTTDDVALTPSFYFSQNFAGLIDPQVSSEVVLTDIAIGSRRQFTVIAVPTTDPSSCKNLLDQPFDKGSMLKPRIVGSVTQDISAGGDPVIIAVDTANPTDTFEDCVITETKLNFPHAEKTIIEQETFPFNYMRANSKPIGAICQPLMVGLRASISGTDREVPAALNFNGTASVLKSRSGSTFQVIKTYNTHEYCIADTYGTAGSDTFTLQRNQTSRKRWIRVPTETGSTTYKAALTDPVPEIDTYQEATFKLGLAGHIMIDHNIPRVLQLDTCYLVSSTLRSITGEASQSATAGLIMTNSGTAGLEFFQSASDCKDGIPSPNITIASGSRGEEYWIKAPSTAFGDGQRIDYYLTYPGEPFGSTATPFTPRITIYTAAETQLAQLAAAKTNSLNIDQLGYASTYTKIEMPNVAGGCYPVTVNINNQFGAAYASNPGIFDFDFDLRATAVRVPFENVPLRFQQVDIAKNNILGGYTINFLGSTINNPNPCQYSDVDPIGSVSTPTGGIIYNSSGTNYTFFIKTVSGTTDADFGRRRIQLYYAGSTDDTTIGYPIGQIDFELTKPD